MSSRLKRFQRCKILNEGSKTSGRMGHFLGYASKAETSQKGVFCRVSYDDGGVDSVDRSRISS